MPKTIPEREDLVASESQIAQPVSFGSLREREWPRWRLRIGTALILWFGFEVLVGGRSLGFGLVLVLTAGMILCGSAGMTIRDLGSRAKRALGKSSDRFTP